MDIGRRLDRGVLNSQRFLQDEQPTAGSEIVWTFIFLSIYPLEVSFYTRFYILGLAQYFGGNGNGKVFC